MLLVGDFGVYDSPKCSAEAPPSVHTQESWVCLTEKIGVRQACSGVRYSTVGCEFSISESAI